MNSSYKNLRSEGVKRQKITEENYIERLRLKDERALEYVIDEYSGLLYSILRKNLVLIPDKIDECFDDILMKVWDNADKYNEDLSSFKGWIAAIARYQSIDYLRKAKRENSGRITEYLEEGLIEPGGLDVRLRLIEETISDESEQILSCLSPSDRELFKRLFIDEEDINNISNDMGISKPLIYNRVSRGKKKLRNILRNNKETAYEAKII